MALFTTTSRHCYWEPLSPREHLLFLEGQLPSFELSTRLGLSLQRCPVCTGLPQPCHPYYSLPSPASLKLGRASPLGTGHNPLPKVQHSIKQSLPGEIGHPRPSLPSPAWGSVEGALLGSY